LLSSWELEGGALVRSILPSARAHFRGADFSLFLPLSSVRRAAIAWRLGYFGKFRCCPCGDEFICPHVWRCGLLLQIPPSAFADPFMGDAFRSATSLLA